MHTSGTKPAICLMWFLVILNAHAKNIIPLIRQKSFLGENKERGNGPGRHQQRGVRGGIPPGIHMYHHHLQKPEKPFSSVWWNHCNSFHCLKMNLLFLASTLDHVWSVQYIIALYCFFHQSTYRRSIFQLFQNTLEPS